MTWGDSHQGVVQLKPSSTLPGRHSKAHCSHKEGEDMTWIWSLFFLHILSHMGTVGVLPNPGSFHITHQCHKCRKCKHWFHDSQIQPDRAKIHRWHQTKDNKHPKLVAEVTLCHNAYDKIRIDPPNAAEEKHKIWSPPCQT